MLDHSILLQLFLHLLEQLDAFPIQSNYYKEISNRWLNKYM